MSSILPAQPEYTFTHAFPRGHFVREYIECIAPCTDAAYDYHEACALSSLAVATPGVRIAFPAEPDGLRTNLNVILIGASTVTHKTTAVKHVLKLLKQVFTPAHNRISSARLPEHPASTEAFAESISNCAGHGCVWCVDEITHTLSAIQRKANMAGVDSILLELYDTTEYTSPARTVGKSIIIKDAHLNVIGCTTPDAIFGSRFTATDVESGLLIRFAVIMPDENNRPPRKGLFDVIPPGPLDALVQTLQTLPTGVVTFEPAAQRLLNEFDRDEYEPRATQCPMVRRLNIMSLKVAALSAVSRGVLVVTADDVLHTLTVIERWMKYAEDFHQRIGENDIDKLISRVRKFMDAHGGTVTQSEVAQHIHVPAPTLNIVRETMRQRGEIDTPYATTKPARGPTPMLWIRL